jgi:RimJ/RimL family protein N-acetyltransferase
MDLLLSNYKCLIKQRFNFEEFEILPIRFIDRYKIMKWRNEQLYHLRQEKLLTKKNQDFYFNSVIQKQFTEAKPDQILFSFLKNNKLIGYGGLVHIDWEKKNGEISFLMDTSLELFLFENLWTIFLKLIEQLAFDTLGFIKIFTFSFDVRPKLYEVLKKNGFLDSIDFQDRLTLSKHKINIKYSKEFNLIPAKKKDSNLIFQLSNDDTTRMNSINSNKIDKKTHNEWLKKQFLNKNIKMFICFEKLNPVGFLKLEEINDEIFISFNVAKQNRGNSTGSKIIDYVVSFYSKNLLVAYVLSTNDISQKIFEKYDFKLSGNITKNNKKILKYIKPIKND